MRSSGDAVAVKYAVMSIVVFVAVAIVFVSIRDMRTRNGWWEDSTGCSASDGNAAVLAEPLTTEGAASQESCS